MIKKPFIILTVFFIILLNVNAAPLRVKYKPNNMSSNQFGFYFQLENTSGAAINLEDVKLYYYFTKDTTSSSQLAAASGPFGNNIELIYNPNLYPQPGATDIIEINFGQGAGTLADGAITAAQEVTFTGGVSTCDNDLSYDPTISSSGACMDNMDFFATLNDIPVWGSDNGIPGQYLAISGGWYNETQTTNVANHNFKVRNADDHKIELASDQDGRTVVYDFKDIFSTTDFATIEKVTVKLLHHEDPGIGEETLALTFGSGLKPGETPLVLAETYLPPLSTVSNENWFEWDVTDTLSSIADINAAQLKLVNNSGNFITRINEITIQIDYLWPGKYPGNAVSIGSQTTRGITLKYGHAYVSLPYASGSLEVSSGAGFEITVEGMGFPTSTFPRISPYYIAAYPVTSSLIKITRYAGSRSLSLKYTD